jgi:Acetyltransferase (GNAT) family
MQICQIENSRLVKFCDARPLSTHFLGYVFKKAPDALSWAALDSQGNILGILGSGKLTGHFEVFYEWLITDSEYAAAALIECYLNLLETDTFPRGLCFDLVNRDAIEKTLGQEWKTTFDQMLVLTPRQLTKQMTTDGLEFIELDAHNYSSYKIHPEIAPSLGSGKAITQEGIKVTAAIKDNCVIAIAEATVRFCNIASVQQVVCIPELRGKGICSRVVEKLCRDTFSENINVATYIAAETNPASIRLAQKVGFELHTRWGFAEKRD